MEECCNCHRLLDFENFAKHRDGLASRCRACQSEYCKAHYRGNFKVHNQRRRRNQARYRARNRKLVTEYLLAHPCVDCGESNVRVLEFDLVRGKKEADVSNLVRQGWAWQRMGVAEDSSRNREV